ncbi:MULTISPECIES: DUF2683 family protein [unclassified Flavobacterium]|jgi:hypothetical protein|uniref:DUF2683 family protein n=1 Tax=unclassified Flavobacterium TaxID=196869 RepID=UPI0025C542A8|nr:MULTISPECIES: DUF2683 family protein [unclassified Flavobacterium]
MNAINITVYPDDVTQIENLKAVMKAFKIKFKVVDEHPYDPEFVKKILKGREDSKQGKGLKISLEELNSLWK